MIELTLLPEIEETLRAQGFFGGGAARRGRSVWTMPIKGTRSAGGGLVESEKDAAEHVMIVDLERDDVSRACELGSVGWLRAHGRADTRGRGASRVARRGAAASQGHAYGRRRDVPGRLGHRGAVAGGRIHLWVGGGIVWDSDPEEEIEESCVKPRPLLAAVGSSLREPAPH